jgi:iron(III) transport system ATP-binding protein
VSVVLRLDHVSVRKDGREILRDVSFELDEGTVLAVAGPSGSGKTTLARVVLGLLAPTAGEVSIDGARASSPSHVVLPPNERGVGAVFQDLALWPHLTVGENLAFGLESMGIPTSKRKPRIREALMRVGLPEFEARRPQALSGGEQQRVALARAMITEPRLLVLDEPFAGLDVVTKDEIVSLLVNVLAEPRRTAIVVTHDPVDASRLANRLAILERGHLVQFGPIDELATSPASPFVASFLARSRGTSPRPGE